MDSIMGLAKLSVARKGYIGAAYGAAKLDQPLVTTVEVQGAHGKVEMTLSPEVGARIVAVIAEELAAETKRVADAMTADFMTIGQTPMLEG